MSRDCSLACPDEHLVVLTTCGAERTFTWNEKFLTLGNNWKPAILSWSLFPRQLEEANGHVAESQQYQHELEEQLTKEKRQGRLRVLDAKEEVRDCTERTIDKLRIERDRLKSEFQHELKEKDTQIAALREQ